MWPFHRHKPLPKKQDVLATQVRVKSITRPLTKQGNLNPPPGVAQQISPVESALQQFLRTSSWQETRQILDRAAPLLLSEDAQTILRRYIQDVRASRMPEAVNIAMYLEAHRLLLERARAIGIGPAWDEFLAIRPVPEKTDEQDPNATEAQATMDALRELLGTETWSQTHAVLIRLRERLLTESADQMLSALIQLAMQESSKEAVESIRYLELHRNLLRDARTLDIDRAWANFERARQDVERGQETTPLPSGGSNARATPNPAAVSEALRTLLTTTDWDETRRVLEAQQALLLTDICDIFISQLLVAAQNDPDPRARRGEVYLELHRNLLRHARQDGIPAAWEVFLVDLRRVRQQLDEEPSKPRVANGQTDLAAVHRAVRELISAPSRQSERIVLDARRGVLLTDDAVHVITDEADRMERRGTQRDVTAVRQLRHQAKLLTRARDVGIDRAWSEYEAEAAGD